MPHRLDRQDWKAPQTDWEKNTFGPPVELCVGATCVLDEGETTKVTRLGVLFPSPADLKPSHVNFAMVVLSCFQRTPWH